MSGRRGADHARAIAVLHVDDEPDLSELSATFLERENERLTVETARDADDALDRLADAEFDCVVSDYDMPGRNGIELLEIVRERFDELPFILYTGKGSEEVASEAVAAGVTEYLQKETGTGQYTILANRISNAVTKHRSNTALNESQKRLSLFIEQSPLGVLEYDEAFEVVGLNATGEEILGYTEAELAGRSWEVLVAEESYENVAAVTEKLSQARGGYHSIDENVRKDGERIVCEWYNRVITDDNDEVVAVFSLFQEITERIEHEQALEETTARLEALFEESPDMINVHDEAGNIIDPNSRLCEKTGYTEAALTEMKIWDIDRSIEPNWARSQWAEMDQGAQKRLTGVYQRSDGSTFPAEIHIRRRDFDGEAQFVVISRDITERLEREQALTRSEQKFEKVFEHANDAIFIVDPASQTFIDCNSAATELLGVPKRQVLDDIAPAETHPDDVMSELEAFFEEVMAEGRSYTDQVPVSTADGDVRPVEMSAVYLELDGRPCIVNHVRDRTEQAARKRENELQNQRLKEFTSGVGHDLRNPLQVAQGRVELLREEIDSRHLNVTETALQRAEQLIDNLLTLSQSGEKIDSLATVTLADAAEASWETVPTEGATLTVEAPGVIRADESRLRQLFENLFGNAVVHGGESVAVTVGRTETGFYVADDGPGIPADERERVFGAGYSTITDGTGFGLRIVAQIAKAHGWTVDIAESGDGGAQFEITGADIDP